LRHIIAVALSQALRLGEVLGLQVEDVDFANNKLRVRRTLDRKRNLGPTKHAKLTGKRDPRDLHPIFLFTNTLGRPRGAGPCSGP
jgi:integrase